MTPVRLEPVAPPSSVKHSTTEQLRSHSTSFEPFLFPPESLVIHVSMLNVESLFSIACKGFRSKRCSLKDDTFEKLMMIKCNHQSNNLKIAD